MDYVQVSEWLKNTILGIIILGAIGSIAAGFIIWLCSKLVKFSTFLVIKIFGQNLAKFFYRLFTTILRY